MEVKEGKGKEDKEQVRWKDGEKQIKNKGFLYCKKKPRIHQTFILYNMHVNIKN